MSRVLGVGEGFNVSSVSIKGYLHFYNSVWAFFHFLLYTRLEASKSGSSRGLT